MYKAALAGEPSPYRTPPPIPEADREAMLESNRWRSLTVAQRRAEVGEEEWLRRIAPMPHDQVRAMLHAAWNAGRGR
jgi:hypothetical protein